MRPTGRTRSPIAGAHDIVGLHGDPAPGTFRLLYTGRSQRAQWFRYALVVFGHSDHSLFHRERLVAAGQRC